MASRVVIVMCFWYHSTNQNNDVVSSGTAQGEGLGGGVALPRHFSAVQNKNKESSNKIEEEISLVRNGVKLQFNVSKTVDADIANIKSNVSNDNY